MSTKYFTYDLETLVNFFSFTGKFLGDDRIYSFEISPRKTQRGELLSFLSYLQNLGPDLFMVGYNNLGFDYPLIHQLLNNPYTFDENMAYQLCQQIINSQQGYGNNYSQQIPLRDRLIPQLDVMKINHFDNANKRTSLKALEFAMRLSNIEDIPVKLGVPLTYEQMDQVLKYNAWDVHATETFLVKCMKHVEIRQELLRDGILTGDVMNFSDVKIGTEYLIKRIGRAKCFTANKPRQTFRESVAFKDVILPKISFRTEPFQEVLEWFNKQIVYTKSEDPKPKLEVELAGLTFDFGVGGVHASVHSRKYVSNETHVIKDIDVSGMYVAVGIANNFAPEHLGQEFRDAYKQLQTDRARHKKGSTMNLILKLAGNGVFGNSDSPFSCFYDPKYPKAVTINGQLQLLQLVEVLSLIPGLSIIQVNTDGVTSYVPREVGYLFDIWKKTWESDTALKLEEVEYKKMWIRDVNNYLAIDDKSNIKAKGAYWFPRSHEDYWGGSGSQWNKDFSAMVVQKVTEETLINDWNPEALVRLMTDPFDFMIRYKVPAGATVFIGDKEMNKTIRYYVSKSGQVMKKIATPKGELGAYKRKNGLLDSEFKKIAEQVPAGTWDDRIHTKNKSKYEEVETKIESGRLVKECNNAEKFNFEDVDWEYYIEEVKKLCI